MPNERVKWQRPLRQNVRATREDLPKCVVLTEWGYEFSQIDGGNGRSRFTQLVADELAERGCDAYYAPLPGNAPSPGQRPIIPADENLRLRLPDLRVWSGSGFFPLEELLVTEGEVRFSYQQLP